MIMLYITTEACHANRMRYLVDDLARTLATPMPRRRALRLAAQMLAGGVLATLGIRRASAANCTGTGQSNCTCVGGGQSATCNSSQTCCMGSNGASCCNSTQHCCVSGGGNVHCCDSGTTCCSVPSINPVCCNSNQCCSTTQGNCQPSNGANGKAC
jgi:hypothetical protein